MKHLWAFPSAQILSWTKLRCLCETSDKEAPQFPLVLCEIYTAYDSNGRRKIMLEKKKNERKMKKDSNIINIGVPGFVIQGLLV